MSYVSYILELTYILLISVVWASASRASFIEGFSCGQAEVGKW